MQLDGAGKKHKRPAPVRLRPRSRNAFCSNAAIDTLVGIESVPWRTKIRTPMVLITDHWSPIIPKRNPTNSMQTDLAKAAPAKVHVATTFNGISEWMMLPSSPSAPLKASPVPRGENTDHRDMRECNVPAFALQGRIWYVNYLGLQVAK